MSIHEVAKSAGVSQATVSRVINHVPGVSPENIRLVRQAMEQLGYCPPPPERRPGRRSAPRATAGLLAIIQVDGLYRHTPGVLAAHLRGMELEAVESGCSVVLVDGSDPGRISPVIRSDQLAGIILLGSKASPEVLAAIRHLPWVWLSSHRGPEGDSVLAGNHEIAAMATRYLVGRGHKRLAFVSIMSSYPAYPARAEAFRYAASREGVAADILLDEPSDTECSIVAVDLPALRERMEKLVSRLMKLKPQPTGLFVPNDMMTAMIYPVLRARGVEPGRDIEIISCNNEEAYLLGLEPKPATIDIGAELMGRRSVEQLMRKIRHPGETRPVQIAVSPVLIGPGR